jgi:hypothetical protein
LHSCGFAFQNVGSAAAATQSERAGQHHHQSGIPMKIKLQSAMTKLQNAFDPQKSDFLERLLAQEDTRLAHFVPDQIEVSDINQDLVHFRRVLDQGQYADETDTGSMTTVALPLLKSAINKLYFALNRNDESSNRIDASGNHEDVSMDEMSTTAIEETIVDLAAAIDGDEDDMKSFIETHTGVLTRVLKTTIAALYDALNINNSEPDPSAMSSISMIRNGLQGTIQVGLAGQTGLSDIGNIVLIRAFRCRHKLQVHANVTSNSARQFDLVRGYGG